MNGPTRLDRDTLAEIYRLHGSFLMRLLLRATRGDRGRAEDILQETFLRAWQHPEGVSRGVSQCLPWLVTVAQRIAIDHYRMRAARVSEILADVHGVLIRIEDPTDDAVTAWELESALDELPAHHRDVLVELHLKGRSVAETAKRLGIPAGTVKSRNYYAIRALRPMLRARGFATAA